MKRFQIGYLAIGAAFASMAGAGAAEWGLAPMTRVLTDQAQAAATPLAVSPTPAAWTTPGDASTLPEPPQVDGGGVLTKIADRSVEPDPPLATAGADSPPDQGPTIGASEPESGSVESGEPAATSLVAEQDAPPAGDGAPATYDGAPTAMALATDGPR